MNGSGRLAAARHGAACPAFRAGLAADRRLPAADPVPCGIGVRARPLVDQAGRCRMALLSDAVRLGLAARLAVPDRRLRDRSEEHTSELQSRFGISYAVFC